MTSRANVWIATGAVVALLLGGVAWFLLAPPTTPASTVEPPPPDRALDVLLLHGIDVFTEANDYGDWPGLRAGLPAWGWEGKVLPVKYYPCDRGALLDLHDHKSHDAHHGGPEAHRLGGACVPGGALGHTTNTPIEHLAYHFAWLVADRYGDRCVHGVGHSMGGLILRYAVAAVEAKAKGDPRFSEFPERLCLRAAITAGTPHGGTYVAAGCEAVQCRQMGPGSPFLQALDAFPHPNGTGGTRWIAIGSEDDRVVSNASSRAFDPDAWVIYQKAADVTHSLGRWYYDTVSTDAGAPAWVWARGSAAPWTTGSAFWPARWTYLSLAHPVWGCGTEADPWPLTPGVLTHGEADAGADCVYKALPAVVVESGRAGEFRLEILPEQAGACAPVADRPEALRCEGAPLLRLAASGSARAEFRLTRA
ncbi:MAG TPA: hypothetical protein VNZ52_03110 [Candidatus Thermoplasmatota archaeon]|nr:hypothetical protein [Candidatus Thermoplasmatota archaeon]